MRISPSINRLTRRMLHYETGFNNRPINFLTHPNEFIDEKRTDEAIQKRGSNYVSYLLGDVLRHQLKVKNLGEKAIPIYAKELEFFQEKEYSFLTLQQYYDQNVEKLTQKNISTHGK